jgi:hypothetical protein
MVAFPLTAPAPFVPSERQLQELARRLGVALWPAVYELQLTAGLASDEPSFTPDSQEGPFLCTRLSGPFTPFTGGVLAQSVNEYEVTIKSGSRTLTEGRVRGQDLISLSPVQPTGGTLEAPIVVLRGDTLRVGVAAPAGTTCVLNSGMSIMASGFHVRSKTGARLGRLADEFAAAVRQLGEFFACGVVASSRDSSTVSSDCVITAIVVDVDSIAGGTRENPTSVRAELGNLDLFPQGLSGLGINSLYNTIGIGMALSGINIEVPAGQRVTVAPAYPGVLLPSSVRVSLQGRRAPR